MRHPVTIARGLALLLLAFAGAVHAEAGEVRLARQLGITFLPLMVIEQQKLVEKHARAAGLTDVKATHLVLGTPSAINDAIISGAADFVAVGVPSFATLWARTRGTPAAVIGVSNVTYLNMLMNTRNPRIRSIRDLTERDRIVLTAPKVSLPAIILQMAAAKEWGYANYTKLDALGVGMAHPDGMAALLSGGQADICCHFTSPPYQNIELQQPGVRTVLSVEQVMGGPTTGTMLFTTAKFRAENPKLYGAVFAALSEAIVFINGDKKTAADLYQQMAKDKSKFEDLLAQLNDPSMRFDLTPLNTMKYFEFMYSVGSIKAKPASWREVFAPEVHKLPGS
jgi:NitT/TauT family transport system substrate-binding protein